MNILNFFGFKTAPFVTVEAGGFFYVFSTQSRVMARILSFLNGEKDLLLLVGEKGTGKTSVVKRAIEYIPIDTRKVVYITIPSGAGIEWIVRRLNKVTGAEGSLANLASLFDVVIIDGFEGASEKANIEQDLSNSSATVLLITREKVKGKNVVELEPPPASELKKYLQGYLNYAGGSSEIFTGEAIEEIVEFSNGDIGFLNRLAWSSLYQAYLSSLRKVTEKEVEIAYMELAGVAEEMEGEKKSFEISSGGLVEEATSGVEAGEITDQEVQEEGVSVEAVSEEMEEVEGTSAELETLLKELEGEKGVAEEESEGLEAGKVAEEVTEEESVEGTLSEETGGETETEVSFEEFGEMEGEEEIEVTTEGEGKGEEVEVEEGGEEEEIEELLDQLGVEGEEIEISEAESAEIEVESVEEDVRGKEEEKGGEEDDVDVDSLLEELGVEEGEKVEDAIEIESEDEGGEAALEVEAGESSGEEDLDAILSEFDEEGGGEDRLKDYEDEEVDALFKEITVGGGEEKVEEKEEKKEKKSKKKKGEEELEDEELKKLLDELDFDDL